MKQNIPVTWRERQVPPGEVLVSKTDLRGTITYANSTFAEVSGYRLDELVGQGHNLVRHPDVPPQIFEDMWGTLKKGLPWRGILKNRAKNGDFYWVESFVMPILADRKVAGYQSVRRRARREDVAAAERHYREVAAGRSVACPRGIGPDRWLSIRRGINLGIAYVAALLLAGVLIVLGVMHQAETELRSMYESKLRAGDTLARIKFLMADNRAQVMLGLLHEPANPLAATHDHPMSNHSSIVRQSRDEITRLWETFVIRGVSGETAKLAEDYWSARRHYVREGLEPALRALDAGNFREASRLVGARINPLYDQANRLADRMMQRLLDESAATYASALERHARIRDVVLIGIAVALSILALGGFLFFRGIMGPLDRGIASLLRIAQGDLSGTLEVEGGGEIGRFNAALAMTQAQLQVMTDEIANGVTRVSTECGMLNSTVRQISDGIDEQHERVHQVADRLAESVQSMGSLSRQIEAAFQMAEQSEWMVQRASKEFSGLLIGMLIAVDALFLFREQLGNAATAMEKRLAIAKTDDDMLLPIRASLEEIRKIEDSMLKLGRKIEQEKPWEMAHGSTFHVIEELGKELARMARELAAETRIQSFASEDSQREMGKVALFLVENREAMHAMWQASSNLADLAASLENMVGGFHVD